MNNYINNNNFEDKQEYDVMPMRVYYILFHLLIFLLYIFVFFYFDKFLFLFRWIDYELLSKIIPDIFIPQLGDNGSYEKSVIIGVMTFLLYIITPMYAFVSHLKKLIKYGDNIIDKKTKEFFKGILGGHLDKTSHLIILLTFGILICWCVLFLGKTTCYMKESLIDICGVYCLAIVIMTSNGMSSAQLIYRFFISKIQ